MAFACPQCAAKTARYTDVRYLPGDFIRDKYQTVHSVLRKYKCPCKAVYHVRKDIPADTQLAAMESLLTDMAIWQQALSAKPGVQRMGTTASDYTKLIHRDVAMVYKQVLRRA